MTRPRAAVALLVAALVAGCGGGSGGGGGQAAYEDAVNDYFEVEIPATDAYEAEAEEADDLAGYAAVLAAGLEGSERRFAAFRAAAEPPGEVAQAHEDLVDTVATELRLGDEFVAAARAGDEDRIAALEAELEPVLERFDDLQRRFDEAGYDVTLPEP